MTTKYERYEPGEPDDLKHKEEKENKRKLRKEKISEFAYLGLWVSGVLAVILLIVFGFNRLIHWINTENRLDQQFFVNCVNQNGRVYNYNDQQVCIIGDITKVDVGIESGKKQCLANGDFPVYDTPRKNLSFCVHGKIVEIR